MFKLLIALTAVLAGSAIAFFVYGEMYFSDVSRIDLIVDTILNK